MRRPTVSKAMQKFTTTTTKLRRRARSQPVTKRKTRVC
jgi:hypothetical protein